MNARMPRRIGLTLILVAFWSVGCTKVRRIGGGWEVETRTAPMPESGNVTIYLYRRSASGRRYVGRIGDWRYYGDDCVLYETGLNNHQYFVACEDRKPVPIVTEYDHEWKLEPTEMIRLDDDPNSFGKKPGRRISIEDLKRQAMSSPVSGP